MPARLSDHGQTAPNDSNSWIRSSTFVTPSPLVSVGQGLAFGIGGGQYNRELPPPSVMVPLI